MTDLLELARPAGLADVQAGTRAPARVSTGAPGRCGAIVDITHGRRPAWRAEIRPDKEQDIMSDTPTLSIASAPTVMTGRI